MIDSSPRSTQVSAEAFSFQIKRCGKLKDLHQAKQLHDAMKNTGSALILDRYLLNLLVEMYSRCGSLENSEAVFESIPQPNLYSWNIMLAAYARNGHLQKAKSLFNKMPERDAVSWNSLLSALSRRGEADEALKFFNSAPFRNSVTWFLLISAFSNHKRFHRALECFLRMDQEGFGTPNEACFVLVLECCGALQDLRLGKLIHEEVASMAEKNVQIATCLINMYARCKRIEQAEMIFDQLQEVNIVAQTCMIQAYSFNGLVEQAGVLFDSIAHPDVVASTSMLTAYAQAGDINHARRIYSSIPVKNVVSSNAMITAFIRNDCMSEAKELFDSMIERDEATWLIILRAYTDKGDLNEAMNLFAREDTPKNNKSLWSTLIAAGDARLSMKLFRMMILEGIQPDEITVVAVLDACSCLSDISTGNSVHEIILRCRMETSAAVGTSLINMLSRCGRLDEAIQAFNRIETWDVVSWSALILSYARAGYSREALDLLPEMCNLGIQPNEVTWIAVLFACSHAGEIELSCSSFGLMMQDFFLKPGIDHFVCVVDLLGRSGWLDAAEQLIKRMPPDCEKKIPWMTLLAACKLHGDSKRAARIAHTIFQSDPNT